MLYRRSIIFTILSTTKTEAAGAANEPLLFSHDEKHHTQNTLRELITSAWAGFFQWE